MAATDKTYRNQKTLNVIFAVSCVLMFASILWMLYDDYHRSWKSVQREFRDVETLVNERAMLEKLPKGDDLKKQIEAVKKARETFQKAESEVAAKRNEILVEKDKATEHFQVVKADLDSAGSYYDLYVDKLGNVPEVQKPAVQAQVDQYRARIDDLKAKLKDAQQRLDDLDRKLATEVTAKLEKPQKDLNDAQDALKALTDNFTRLAKVTAEKRWKLGDTIRDLPILDGFSPPTKIQQVTLAELPIDYGGFKEVTRYDRCATCHLGIERANYARPSLLAILPPDNDKGQKHLQDIEQRLSDARRLLTEMVNGGEKLPFDIDDLPSKVHTLSLTPGQLTMYAAHPRMDLFVESNSPHPMEKFGCTSCHNGQGSGTDFYTASHTPNDAVQMERWQKGHSKTNPDSYHWHANHDWDTPMMPRRFAESMCVKCHHQVTDLIRFGNKEESPKLIQGYELVRDNGCFGCHEIAGTKSGREIGPDMRAEPNPPLEWLPAAEQAKMRNDTQNPPGTFRKVGPGLRRLTEKTTSDWVSKWIKDPRGFRPDTKMPHFFGLSTNSPSTLPEDQKAYPDAEIVAATFYLMDESQRYLQGKDFTREVVEKQVKDRQEWLSRELTPEEKREVAKKKKELDTWTRRYIDLLLLAQPLQVTRVNDEVAKLQLFQDRLAEQQNPENENPDAEVLNNARAGVAETMKVLTSIKPQPVEAKLLIDAAGQDYTAGIPPRSNDPKHLSTGRKLFSERGCLACHSHDATTKPGDVPVVEGVAQFGPDLSRVAAKIKKDDGGRAWLVQWLVNPNVHSPRTRMPITHLTVPDAAAIADWLLSRTEEADTWKADAVPEPTMDTLEKLATIYVAGTSIGKTDAADVVKTGMKDVHKQGLAPDADEWMLEGPEDKALKLKRYIGKKAIGRLGCYGCHDIPGFETAKPIGTALNDWGKKDPARLAFEDGANFVKTHFNVVDLRESEKQKGTPAKEWKAAGDKPPYEKYFAEAIEHHQREGFLHLKLANPRSYDYRRLRSWEDRLRMPQFRFARSKKKADESDEEFERRREYEEARAREAVMTFILGLVAEPVPSKYVYHPNLDKMNEIKGRHVLEKFNCGGCHQIRPGLYEFNFGNTPRSREQVLQWLKIAHDQTQAAFKGSDHIFPDSNAWIGQPSPFPDRQAVKGVPRGTEPDPEDDTKLLQVVRLTDAFTYTIPRGEPRAGETFNVAAGQELRVPMEVLTQATQPYGGTFSKLMLPYLDKLDPQSYRLPEKDSDARTVLPPPLIREGERVQPQWVYQFLLNPQKVRPVTILRMPKFNMSEEEARAMVNYFASVDKVNNPGIGLTESYVRIPQRDPRFWSDKSGEYVRELKAAKKEQQRLDNLKPIWDLYLKDQVTAKEREVKAAEDALKVVKPEEKATAEKALATLKQELQTARDQLAKKDVSALEKNWAANDAYASDAYRQLAGPGSPCLSCHSVGNVRAQKEQGPNLALTAERLRPEWTLQWIAAPNRMYSYAPTMPQNFPNVPKEQRQQNRDQAIFYGYPFQRATAVRDALMDLPRVSELPANRYLSGSR